MKNMKTLILTIGIFILISPITYCIAWNNGNSGSAYADNDVSYSYDDNFGTHDWIANAALDKLWANNQTKWQWLKARKTIYLVGTEAPDNSGVQMTLDGTLISGFGDTTYHHIYFNEDGTVIEEDAALRTKTNGDLADARIDEGKLEQAAFYLGAMTHYIADMSMYAHVAENNVPPYNINFDEHHSTVEGYVQTRTNEYNDQEDFFKFSIFTIGSKKPYNACLDLAWDTYKDPTPSAATTRDAKWMHDNFFTGWKQTYTTRADDTATHQLYYNRVEESLNLAIQACINAINYVAGSETTQTSGSDGTSGIDGETIGGFDVFLLMVISTIGIVAFFFNIRKKRR
jgi:hypothetical protein